MADKTQPGKGRRVRPRREVRASSNDAIRDCIKRGLRLDENGEIVLPHQERKPVHVKAFTRRTNGRRMHVPSFTRVQGEGKNKKRRFRGTWISKNGYKTMHLNALGEQWRFTVARVLCWLHHGPPPTASHVVDHINRKKLDDRPQNLRWATPSQNATNCYLSPKGREGRRIGGSRRKGEKNPQHKLTEDEVLEIRGASVHKGLSQKKIAGIFGISGSNVSLIINRKRWKHI